MNYYNNYRPNMYPYNLYYPFIGNMANLNPFNLYPYYFFNSPYLYYPRDNASSYDSFINEINENKDASYINYSKNAMTFKDYGPDPFIIDINEASIRNTNYRTTIWTGKYLQVTLMSIDVGGDIGLEIHPDTDQFLRIESGQGIAKMGTSKNNLNFQRIVRDDDAILIPANTWHNVINTGNTPLKLYSIYAPPHHPHGTIHKTKKQAMEETD